MPDFEGGIRRALEAPVPRPSRPGSTTDNYNIALYQLASAQQYELFRVRLRHAEERHALARRFNQTDDYLFWTEHIQGVRREAARG